MSRLRRQLTPFSLSFLDIMSCGFGAAILLFLIIKHNIDTDIPVNTPSTNLSSEVSLLEEEILIGKKNLAEIKNTLEATEQELIITQGRASKINQELSKIDELLEKLKNTDGNEELESIKQELIQLEQQKLALEKELEKSGNDARKFAGDGDRAYVTGLKLDGKRSLILLDSSASMLDSSIVNVIRRRNMSDSKKITAPKWQHAKNIIRWLTAKLPLDSQFQLYQFNTNTNSVYPNSKGTWIKVRDKNKLDSAISNVGKLIPEQGTNLEQVFQSVKSLNPKPDNIYLITDGLPTRDAKKPRGSTISGADRLRLFNKAIKQLPGRTPVNVILLPMEGDPYAPIAFWRLAQSTNGSFMSPSKDWP